MAIAEPPNTILSEILDFLASTPTSEQIIGFKTSERLNERLHYLLDQNSRGVITPQEHTELEEFLRMDHFFTQLKIRVRSLNH